MQEKQGNITFDDILIIRMKSSVKNELEKKAKQTGLTMSDIARILIQRWLKDGKNLL